MTATAPAADRVERLEIIWEERPGLLGWLTTVDHKRIGLLYLFTSLAFLLARSSRNRMRTWSHRARSTSSSRRTA
jgi:hypothetical protein